jgi:hypothetical protein
VPLDERSCLISAAFVFAHAHAHTQTHTHTHTLTHIHPPPPPHTHTHVHKVTFADVPDKVVASPRAFKQFPIGNLPVGSGLLIPDEDGVEDSASKDFLGAVARGPACSSGCCLLATIPQDDEYDGDGDDVTVTIVSGDVACEDCEEGGGRSVPVGSLGIVVDAFDVSEDQGAAVVAGASALDTRGATDGHAHARSSSPLPSHRASSPLQTDDMGYQADNDALLDIVPEKKCLLFQGFKFLLTRLETDRKKMVSV